MTDTPMQPLEYDSRGTVRFKANELVRFLLDSHPYVDLNRLAELPHISDEDHEQFAQLIGYSLGGFSELGYVHHDTLVRAEQAAEALKVSRGSGC